MPFGHRRLEGLCIEMNNLCALYFINIIIEQANKKMCIYH